jgi:hypothetical protein
MHGLGDETDKSGNFGSAGLRRLACVYTTLIGGYEVLNEQPIAATSRLPFICLHRSQLRADEQTKTPARVTGLTGAQGTQRLTGCKPPRR